MITAMAYNGPEKPPADSMAGFRVDLVGTSLDTKPTDVGNGSTFFEMDTAKAYMFNEDGPEWDEI